LRAVRSVFSDEKKLLIGGGLLNALLDDSGRESLQNSAMELSTKSRFLIGGIYVVVMDAFTASLTWFIYEHHASFGKWAVLMAAIFVAVFAIPGG
jgi:hypothetical protein